MKKRWMIVFLTFTAFAVLSAALFSCSNSVEQETGTITISLSGAAADNARAAVKYPPEDTSLLTHKIIITGPGPKQEFTLNSGSTTRSFTVIPGSWTVTVEASVEGELYATGKETNTIEAGKNTVFKIQMGHVGYKITMTSSNDEWGSATADANRAVKDATVAINAEPEDGYRIQVWQVVSGGASLGSTTENSTTFKMPDDEVAIMAVFEEVPPNTPSLYMETDPVTFTFADVSYGYTQPGPATVMLHNSGNFAATVSSIALTGANAASFTLSDHTSIASVDAGESETFKLQPNADLSAGDYTATITVTYSGGTVTSTTATFSLTFKVDKLTPEVSHYDIGNLTQTIPNITVVTINPKTGILVSSGNSTIYYEGMGTTTHAKSTATPTNVGTYAVTFDVAAVAPNWDAAVGLNAGTLTINAGTLGDISISNTGTIYVGDTLTANYSGTGTVKYQWLLNDAPITGATAATFITTAAGSYTVTVSAENYNSKTSDAVTVAALQTPVAGDFTFGNLSQTAGSTIVAVSITANSGKTTGTISNIRYNNSTTLPTATGSYPVTFDVAAATGWNAASNLSAGTLTINVGTLGGTVTITPSTNVYVDTELTATYNGSETGLTFSYQWKHNGANVGTDTNKYTPTTAGSYTVTVSAENYTSKTSDAVTVAALQTPVAGDFTFGNLSQTAGSTIVAVTITANSGKTSGVISNIRYNGSTTLPTATGNYPVLFDVAAATGWNAASNLSAGTLTINAGTLGGTVTITPNTNVYTNTELTASYSGSETGLTLSYQWKHNGANVGTNSNKYTPTTAGSYTVTVSAANYNSKTSDPVSVSGLSNPVAGDFTFGNLTQTAGSTIVAVTITANTGKTGGVISNIRYNNSTTLPTAPGSYPVTFDVAAATGWNAASNLSAGTLTISKANPTVTWPTGLTAVYGQTLANITLPGNGGGTAGSFSWTTGNSTSVGAVGTLSHSMTFTPTDTTNYNTSTQNVSVTVNKAAGATVSAPTAAGINANSITLSAVSASTGQAVEYARNSTDTAPTSGWQDSLTFNGLNANTTYFFFARAKSNANYETGTASSGTAITTAEIQTGSVGFTYYWVDEDTGTLNITGATTVAYGSSVTFAAGGSGYTDQYWTLNGEPAGTAASYLFNTLGKAPGRDYLIGLRVQKGGSYYYREITVKVGS